ncbi:hypothetical protein [Moorena sp. SIO2C4]|uniref:hypothetical protein n=1 Tax=Moorena sp. SIO2C4 TaxID=2607824 RepID=UPI0013C95211|nr:hypothetical protein [Moorena sp. SIO2C4]NES42704.1 hypothetical protein [Moorena sp. SIO2C4]
MQNNPRAMLFESRYAIAYSQFYSPYSLLPTPCSLLPKTQEESTSQHLRTPIVHITTNSAIPLRILSTLYQSLPR